MLSLSLDGSKKSIMLKEKDVCLVDLEKAFDRVHRKVLAWAMRKKGIPLVFLNQ